MQLRNKSYAEAAENLAKAITLGDKRPQIHYNYILALMKDSDEAHLRTALKTALAKHPSNERLNRLLDRYIKQIVPE